MTENEGFYTITEFAKKMNVHPNTIRRGIYDKRITAINMGTGKKKLYRIPQSETNRIAMFDLEKFIDRIVEERIKEK